MLSDIPDMRVCDNRDFLDVLLMIPDEAKMGHHRSETVPARERRGVDNEVPKIASCLNLGVNRRCQLDEIVLVQLGLWSHQQNGMRSIQVVFDHGLLLDDR